MERVRDNAKNHDQLFDNELNRVIIHGILHYCGFKDKSDSEKVIMRAEEEKCLSLLES